MHHSIPTLLTRNLHNASLAGRVKFDTEADAVCIYASELDARAAASVITGLARRRNQAIP